MGTFVEEIIKGRKTFFVAPDKSRFPESYLEEYLTAGYECYFIETDLFLPISTKIEVILSVFKDCIMFFNIDASIQKENWQIFRFHTRQGKGRFLDFMGFKFYRNRVTIRKKITLKAMRKARRIAAKKNPTVHDARQMLTYIGWTKCTDTYMWLKRHILSRVDFKKLRKIISEHDRRNYHGILQVQEQQKTLCC